MPYAQFLGYQRGRDGKPEFVEEEAKIIRLIYRLYLEGNKPGYPLPVRLVTCSKPKILAVEVQSEKVNISSMLGDGEMILTVLFLLRNRKVKG